MADSGLTGIVAGILAASRGAVEGSAIIDVPAISLAIPLALALV
jgi:hypothetical protein